MDGFYHVCNCAWNEEDEINVDQVSLVKPIYNRSFWLVFLKKEKKNFKQWTIASLQRPIPVYTKLYSFLFFSFCKYHLIKVIKYAIS